jgi:HlyD family secretion protein
MSRGVCALAALLVVAASGCDDEAGAASSGPAGVPVRVLEVAPRDLVRTYTELATLVTPLFVDVATEVAGRIEALPVDEGAHVQRGDVVVRLDTVVPQAQVREARARLAQAEAGRGQAAARVASSEAAVREAEAALSLAGDAFARKEQLRRERATAEATYLEARDQLAVAEARLEVARAELESARASASAQAAAVDVARATLEVAEGMLDKHTVVAPQDGVVVSRGPDVGAMAQPGEVLLRLELLDPLRAEVHLPERLARFVTRGDEVVVRTESAELQGIVSRVAPAVARDTRTLLVEVDVPNADRALRPGTFARVTFALERREGVLAVPEHALRRAPDGEVAVIVAEQAPGGLVARERPVELGLTADGWVEVRDGLAAGERVVTLGAETVVDGTPLDAQAGPP